MAEEAKNLKQTAELSLGSRREFQVENAYTYNVKGPVSWIFSHLLRYPLLPLIWERARPFMDVSGSVISWHVRQTMFVLSTLCSVRD